MQNPGTTSGGPTQIEWIWIWFSTAVKISVRTPAVVRYWPSWFQVTLGCLPQSPCLLGRGILSLRASLCRCVPSFLRYLQGHFELQFPLCCLVISVSATCKDLPRFLVLLVACFSLIPVFPGIVMTVNLIVISVVSWKEEKKTRGTVQVWSPNSPI